MLWPRKRRRCDRPGRVAARAAVERAEAARDAVRGQRPAVAAAVAQLRRLRRENHFAALISAALEQERKR